MRSDIVPGAIFPDYELSDHAAKIHWTPKKMEVFPAATVPGVQHDIKARDYVFTDYGHR